VDLRGHGQSPAEPPAADIAEYTADVARALEGVGLPAAPVVGVSFGGMIATALAINHPERVSALVASACPSAIPDAARETLKARGTAAIKDGMASIVEETLERWFTEAFRAGSDVDFYRKRLLTDDPASWSAAWHAIAGLNLTRGLAKIAVPALCIHAANDRATPLEAMQSTQAGIPGAKLVIIADAPHMVHVEMPIVFGEAVLAFLQAA
jgi:3-oxoadipate enol-lactonase